jgi:hypothetical protein
MLNVNSVWNTSTIVCVMISFWLVWVSALGSARPAMPQHRHPINSFGAVVGDDLYLLVTDAHTTLHRLVAPALFS